MKKVFIFLAATIISTSLPVLAADHAQEGHDQKCIKDCQMLVRNCGQEVESIQQRISRLNREIAKGTSVYTIEELRILERTLQESQDLLENITMEG